MITYQHRAGDQLLAVETEEFILRFHDPEEFASRLRDKEFEAIEVATYDGYGDDENGDTSPVFCARKPL